MQEGDLKLETTVVKAQKAAKKKPASQRRRASVIEGADDISLFLDCECIDASGAEHAGIHDEVGPACTCVSRASRPQTHPRASCDCGSVLALRLSHASAHRP